MTLDSRRETCPLYWHQLCQASIAQITYPCSVRIKYFFLSFSFSLSPQHPQPLRPLPPLLLRLNDFWLSVTFRHVYLSSEFCPMDKSDQNKSSKCKLRGSGGGVVQIIRKLFIFGPFSQDFVKNNHGSDIYDTTKSHSWPNWPHAAKLSFYSLGWCVSTAHKSYERNW